jgi:hypothetical protein
MMSRSDRRARDDASRTRRSRRDLGEDHKGADSLKQPVKVRAQAPRIVSWAGRDSNSGPTDQEGRGVRMQAYHPASAKPGEVSSDTGQRFRRPVRSR